MSLLRFSVPQRRNSLLTSRRTYQSLLTIKNSNLCPKIDKKNEENDKDLKKEVCNISSRCKEKVYKGELLVDNDNPKSIIYSSHKKILKGDINIYPVSSIPNSNDQTFEIIFKEKLKICSYIFDFLQPHIQLNGKQEKSKALNEIYSLLCKNSEVSNLTNEQKVLLLDMISKYIFDQEPFISTKKNVSQTINLTYTESSWEHLYNVFKILNQFIQIFPEMIDFSHTKKAIRLMNLPDINERNELASFLKNYTKSHQDQINDIWTELKNALTNVRYDIYTINCVDPIITYMINQIQSNAISFVEKYPLKILKSHLLPLFKNENLPIYFTKLSSIIIKIIDQNYIEKLNTIQYLLQHFPIQYGKKTTFICFCFNFNHKHNEKRTIKSNCSQNIHFYCNVAQITKQ